MRFIGASAALCCALWSSCGSADQGETRQYEISGTVLDARSGKGIEHALVRFSSDTLDKAETESDATGHFTLEVEVDEGVAFGTVVASHPSYQPEVSESVYFDDLPHVVTLELQAKSASKP